MGAGPLYQVHVVIGGRAELPCDVETQDPTDRVLLVLWYKDGEGSSIYTFDSRRSSQLSARDWADTRLLGGRAHFDIDASPSALVLDKVRESDEGNYRCRVDFKKSPTRNARTNLTVIVPPNPPVIMSGRGVVMGGTVGPYDEGDSLNLMCEVTGGKPASKVIWRLDDKILDDTDESPGEGVFTNSFHLSRLTRKHLDAPLICEASNSNFSAPVQTIITVHVNFKPLDVHFLGSREPLSAGKTYELQCKSIGARPPAKVTWWLEDKELRNTTSEEKNLGNFTLSSLFFTPKYTHGGKHLTCKAESPVIDHIPLQDEWKLEIYYTPIVHLTLGRSLSANNIKEGDDVYFECNVLANPKVYKIVWYHNGNQVHHNVSAGVIISNQSLVIQSVKREQAGLYTCVSSNIEGDGESNALILKVQYAPVCAEEQMHTYGAARHEEVTVTCKLDAVPPVVSFGWRFNNSGDVVDIAESHVLTKGLESSLSYIARTELDYGTLLCWGENKLGQQKKPCIFKVVPAGPPDSPVNCTLSNASSSSLHIFCYPDYDGGLGQIFVAEVYDVKSNHLEQNISESSSPNFHLVGLEPGTEFKIDIYAINTKGPSKRKSINVFTLKDTAERRTAQVRPPPEEDIPITPLLAVGVGVAGSLLLVILVAVVILRLNKEKRKTRPKAVNLQLNTPLSDPSKEPDDQNPDVIPNSGSDPENKGSSTPEEGGFGSVHICASVPSYPSNSAYPSTTYSTLPRKIHQEALSPTQVSDIMYAELAFPRTQYSSSATGSLPRRKPDPSTVYSKMAHERSLSPPFHTKEPSSTSTVPVQFISPTPSMSSSNTVSSVMTSSQSPPLGSGQAKNHRTKQQQYPSHINVPITIPGRDHNLGLGLRAGSSQSPPLGYTIKNIPFGLQEGIPVCLEAPYLKSTNQLSGLSIGYDGPIPPPAILEDEEHTSQETPLMNDHKESEV